MRPGEVIPLVRSEDLSKARELEQSLLDWHGGTGWIHFASVRAEPHHRNAPASYSAFAGVNLALFEREIHDLVQRFFEEEHPDLRVTVQVRRGSVR